MKPKISVVLINYNGEEDTLECIESLEKISYPDYKIIVVDNASESVEKLDKKDNIKLIKNSKNYGFAGGNNIGIQFAFNELKSDYVLLLNNDTIVKSDFLDKLVSFAEESSDIGVVSPQINKYSKPNEINEKNISGSFNLWLGGGSSIEPKEYPYETDYNSGCCWLIKKEVSDLTGIFNPYLFCYKEEIEWAYRINKAGFKFYVVPDSVIYHKGEQTTKKIKGFRDYYEIRNALYFVKSYGSFLQKVFFFTYAMTYKLLKHRNKYFIRGLIDGLK